MPGVYTCLSTLLCPVSWRWLQHVKAELDQSTLIIHSCSNSPSLSYSLQPANPLVNLIPCRMLTQTTTHYRHLILQPSPDDIRINQLKPQFSRNISGCPVPPLTPASRSQTKIPADLFQPTKPRIVETRTGQSPRRISESSEHSLDPDDPSRTLGRSQINLNQSRLMP